MTITCDWAMAVLVVCACVAARYWNCKAAELRRAMFYYRELYNDEMDKK